MLGAIGESNGSQISKLELVARNKNYPDSPCHFFVLCEPNFGQAIGVSQFASTLLILLRRWNFIADNYPKNLLDDSWLHVDGRHGAKIQP